MKSIGSLFTILGLLAWGQDKVFAQYLEDNKGYVLMQAEKTSSPLGQWKAGSTYTGRTGEGHLEFTGNNTNDGPATSPLDYQFTIAQAGVYTLYVSIYQNLQGAAGDQCNDIYVRMSGDFTEAGGATLAVLKADTKLFGGSGSAFAWSVDASLELTGTVTHVIPKYTFKAGQTYTLTVSGRSLRTVIDRILLTTASAKTEGQNSATPESSNKPIIQGPRITYKAINDFTKVTGSTNANYSNDLEMGALYINSNIVSNQKKWAAAELVFNGTPGIHDFYLSALKETDGETSYKIFINKIQIGTTFKNSSISLDSRRIGEIQTFIVRDQALKAGDVIRVESDCSTNGLVPKDSTTSYAEGRWSKLELVPKFVTRIVIPHEASPYSFDQVRGALNFTPPSLGVYTFQFFTLSGHVAASQTIKISGPLPAKVKLETTTLRAGTYFVTSSLNGAQQVHRITLFK